MQEAHILRDMLEGLVTYSAKGEVFPAWLRSGKSATTARPIALPSLMPEVVERRSGEGIGLRVPYRRIMDPATGAKYANILYPIKNAEKINKGQGKPEELGVKAIDDQDRRDHPRVADPYFIELLTHQTSLPVHKASVEKFGKDFVKPGNMVTNGAYKLVEFVPNSHIKLAKNENYYDAEERPDRHGQLLPDPGLRRHGPPL